MEDSSTHLSAGGFGEPQGPFVHQRMLDVEVVGVMENGNVIPKLGLGNSSLRSSILIIRGILGADAILCCGGHVEGESKVEELK